MPKFEHWGFLSENEMFAMKKNVGEDAKLREKLWSLSLDLNFTTDSLKHEIKTVRKDLKEIRQSTGHSPEGIPTIRPTSETMSVSDSFPAHTVPQVMLDRIMKSDYGRHLDLKNPLLSRRKTNMKKVRAITGTVRTSNELAALAAGARRKVKSVGGFQKALLSVDEIPPKSRNSGYRGTQKEPSFAEDEVFETAVDNSSNQFETSNDQSSNQKDLSNDSDKMDATNLPALSSRWVVRHRTGRTIDPLEIPKIKDCYRPMCRLNCSTCLSRKKKAPCFLVPGVNVSYDHFKDEAETGEEDEDIKTEIVVNKNKKAIKSKTVNSSIDDTNETIDSITSYEKEEVNVNTNQHQIEDKDSFIAECLQIKKNSTEKKISRLRLLELSKPKEGYRKELRFSKTFIKKGLARMPKLDPISLMTAAERRKLHRVQGQIALFVAVLNERRKIHVKPLSEVLDFPIREDNNTDVTHLHQPVIMPKLLVGAKKRRRHVHFE